MYKTIAKINKLLLPSLTKQRVELDKATKWQLALIGWRFYITKQAL